jgi:hypothetical protein
MGQFNSRHGGIIDYDFSRGSRGEYKLCPALATGIELDDERFGCLNGSAIPSAFKGYRNAMILSVPHLH